MKSKERIKLSLTHQPVDYIPTQVNYTQCLGMKMCAYFGVAPDELPAFLGNHLLRVDLDYKKQTSQDGKVFFDWWGVGFDADEEGYFTSINPLSNTKDFDAYAWPDPNDPKLLRRAAELIEDDQGQHFVCPNFGFALFERAWSLRGFDNFFMDMVLDTKFSEELLDRITEIQLVLIKRFIQLGVDGGYFGDDYGAQKNMLFSPKTWRTMIKPRLAKLFAPFREAGLPVLMHSDGQIAEILPDLIEIGLTTYNPVQPEVIDHTWLKSTFGERLAYYGGISTQTILPYGKPGEISQAVYEVASILAPNGTGLMIAPSHRMMTDIPIENIEEMLEAFAKLRE
ncbi:uroporphyrinogen decarboxylase family protein [Chloroflexota bacterium]